MFFQNGTPKCISEIPYQNIFVWNQTKMGFRMKLMTMPPTQHTNASSIKARPKLGQSLL